MFWWNLTLKTRKYRKFMRNAFAYYESVSYTHLSFDEKIDITNYGGTHYKAILFDNNILLSLIHI